MVPFTESVLLNIFGIFVATVLLVIFFFKKRYSYWKNLGVSYEEPTIPFGNAKESILQKMSIGEYYANFYHRMKARKVKHAGSFFFHKPAYVPLDLDLIKQIMQVDFVHFTDHGGYLNEKDDPLAAHVFALGGQRWRNLRVKLTPTFTSGKMKLMFPIIVKIADELVKTLKEECGKGPIEAKDFSGRFTTDVIGNCAFGIDCNSLKDPNTEFRIQGKRVFNLTRTEQMTNFIGFLFPNLMKFFGATFTPKIAADFFWKVIVDTTEYREKNGIRRNDAMQLLLDMMSKDGKENENTLTFNEVAAQAFVFFIAGFETSSTLMSFALLELAQNQDVQDRLREEVREVLESSKGELTYEVVWEMNYLSMVINETLRKYPPLSILTRECTKDYRVPDTNIIIHKGDLVLIPVKGIQYDPEFYPDPHKFDPLRFTEQNKNKRHPFSFLPFGEGPRICLGMRFGLMQAKLGLVSLIGNFKFKLNSKTSIPVKIDPISFVTATLDGIFIDVEKIN
ncbi:cytochrome p450 [Holotrichia oblita]|uniref:Cytochrome p450 n=1 Tax=Holotrichia oblita TaxID=644536 RepID=A0ACB9SZW3_HOLOL|nr:cytochrome p450 [Holotrichia oblita]